MGSAAIVAAAAQTTHPVRQGLVSMTQTFIDTIIVVSFTGLVIISSGAFAFQLPDGVDIGDFQSQLTSTAFAASIGENIGPAVVAICIVFFALSTVIGWAYYGERCAVSLLGIKVQLPYRVVFTALIVVWAIFPVGIIWDIADILNGLMALPNLIGLLLLSGMIARETKRYLSKDPNLSLGGVEPETPLALTFSDGKVKWVPAEERVAKL
jgi:AGCS family alanine or glycine:cation symporter